MTLKILSITLCLISCSALKLVKVSEEAWGEDETEEELINPTSDTAEPDAFIPQNPNQHPKEVYSDFQHSERDAEFDKNWAEKFGLVSKEAEEAMNATLLDETGKVSSTNPEREERQARRKKRWSGFAMCPPICYNRIVLMYLWKAQLASCQWNKCYGGGGKDDTVAPFAGGEFMRMACAAPGHWVTCSNQRNPESASALADSSTAWAHYAINVAQAEPLQCNTCYERQYCRGLKGQPGVSCRSSYGVEFRYFNRRITHSIYKPGAHIVYWGSKAECIGRKAQVQSTYFPYRNKEWLPYPDNEGCFDARNWNYQSGLMSGGPTLIPNFLMKANGGYHGYFNVAMPDCNLP